ncbi:MAG: hypothetical protein Q8M40_03840 [Legionella sp.]|nr:hypothetical protein [Legionella sp.]
MGITKLRLIFIIFYLFLLSGCAHIGPKIVHRDRYDYNIAIANSNKQELLLNMVRLRYDQVPMFLHIGTISASSKLVKSGALTGRITFPSGLSSYGETSGTGVIEYTDNPIFNYVPYDDKDYTTQLLRPISLRELSLLLQSAWSISRVFRLLMQQTGSSVNAPSAARTTSTIPPNYKEFEQMVNVLSEMQQNDAFTWYYSADKYKIEKLILKIRSNYHLSAKNLQILNRSDIRIKDNKIIFSRNPSPGEVYLSTRSVLGILNYLSKGVMVPPEDAKAHLLTTTRYPNGKLFDWQQVLHDMMKIQYCSTKPEITAVSILYRGRWFYIDDRDGGSKKTLILLSHILGLISSGGQNGDEIPITRVS